MRTYDEVYAAAVRAHEVARLLIYVGDAYGSPKSVEDIMRDFTRMQADPNILSTESGLIRLERDEDVPDFFTMYVNVGPAISDREDF